MKRFKFFFLPVFLFLITPFLFGDIVYIEPYTVNAKKGDIILTGSPDGFIGETLAASFGGYWAHSGMMIDNGYNIRHNTLSVNDLGLNTNWLGVPTGVKPEDLEHGRPGLFTEKTQWVGSTDVVLKPLTANEAYYRPLLEDIADKHIWLSSYYRIHSYVNSSLDDWLNQFNYTNTPAPHTGAHCSGQLWFANFLMGKEMNVFYATPDRVDAGAFALYDGLYELILEEVNNKGGFWGNVLNTLGLINYKSVAEKIANQVVNAFGLDVYNDTGPTWRSFEGKVHTYSVAPDHLIMVSMANPIGNHTGVQTSDSSYYGKIEKTVKGGGYYLDTDTGLPAQKIVTIYQDADFSGGSAVYYKTMDLASLPWNDALTSIRVKPGYKVTLYEHTNYGGSAWSYYCDNGKVPWNDTASSMKIEKSAPPVACIFKDGNYKEIPVCYFGEVSDAKLSDDIGNDTVTSVRIFNPNYKVVLYEHENYGGNTRIYTADAAGVGDFNDKASSVKVLRNIVSAAAAAITASFESYHGKYLGAENGGGGDVNANTTQIGPWEKFAIEGASPVRDGSQIHIRTAGSYYLCAEQDGTLNGNRVQALTQETFTLINHSNPGGNLRNNDTVSLKSVNNKYVVAESDGSANANRSAIGQWEKFTVIIH